MAHKKGWDEDVLLDEAPVAGSRSDDSKRLIWPEDRPSEKFQTAEVLKKKKPSVLAHQDELKECREWFRTITAPELRPQLE